MTGVGGVDALSLPFDLEKEVNQDARTGGGWTGGSTRSCDGKGTVGVGSSVERSVVLGDCSGDSVSTWTGVLVDSAVIGSIKDVWFELYIWSHEVTHRPL